jgi:hypothetical protein
VARAGRDSATSGEIEGLGALVVVRGAVDWAGIAERATTGGVRTVDVGEAVAAAAWQMEAKVTAGGVWPVPMA